MTKLDAKWTNADGILFEPHREGNAIGYRITDIESGRVEYLLLNPTEVHEVNPENGALADTFIYQVHPNDAALYHEIREHHPEDLLSVLDYADALSYTNHFPQDEL